MTQTDNLAHTPGPWAVSSIDGHYYAEAMDGDSPFTVADAWAWKHGKPHKEVGEANARLIAAAPDLLEACEAILAAWNAEDSTFAGVAELAVDKAGVAIAKAKAS